MNAAITITTGHAQPGRGATPAPRDLPHRWGAESAGPWIVPSHQQPACEEQR